MRRTHLSTRRRPRPSLWADLPDGTAPFKKSPDLVEKLLPDSSAPTAHQARLRDSVRGTIRLRQKRQRSLTIVRIDVRLRNRRLIAAKLSLNGLAEVLQQMKTISDLPRLRRALTRGLRIDASTIAADHLHVRVILEPTGRGRRRTIHQHVHHLTTLQVNNDRPVVGALPPRPVIDASHMDGGHGAAFGPSPGVLLQAGQDRRVADRHPEPSHQPLRGPSASAMAKQLDDSRQAGGPARERRRKTRHALGEDAPITQPVSTPPAPEAGINNDRRSLSG